MQKPAGNKFPIANLCICRPFADSAAAGGIVKGLRVPDGGRLSNSRLKPKGDIAAEALAAGAGALIYMR